jgi:hypothetical protein
MVVGNVLFYGVLQHLQDGQQFSQKIIIKIKIALTKMYLRYESHPNHSPA